MNIDLEFELVQQIPCFTAVGYFREETGKKLLETVETQLAQGAVEFIVDFTRCPIVNSPGLSCMIEAIYKVVNEFKGKFIVCGLDNLKKDVFRACGILPLAMEAETFQEALRLLGK